MLCLSGPAPLTCVVGGRPDERVGRGAHGLELHRQRDGVVGAHLEHLLPSHQDAVEVLDGMEEDLDVADAALVPLVVLAVPAEQLCAFLKQDLLVLLPGLCLHLREHVDEARSATTCFLPHSSPLSFGCSEVPPAVTRWARSGFPH